MRITDFRVRLMHTRQAFPDELGLLVLVASLEIPMARERFTAAYESYSALEKVDEKKRMFVAGQDACRTCGVSPWKKAI